MSAIKLTKNELRGQQKKLAQLERYLPTLQLKKAMLQSEVHDARLEIERNEEEWERLFQKVESYSSLFTISFPIDPSQLARVVSIQRRYDNIAGVEVPVFESILFEKLEYSLFDTPPWFDPLIEGLRSAAEARAKVEVSREKKTALEKELRMVSIRVNLFEKILIPRSLSNIKKIKVFLGDQELASVSRAKVAKSKIEMRKEVLHQ